MVVQLNLIFWQKCSLSAKKVSVSCEHHENIPQLPYIWQKSPCHLLNWRLVGLRANLEILGKKRYLALAMIQILECAGNGLVAVFTHNFCECTACCVSRDDHIVLEVKRH
jgi:hypothetical protein